MQNKIIYKVYKKSDYNNLLNFLAFVDEDFYPPLSKRCTLAEYLKNDLLNPNMSLLAIKNQEIVGFINLQLNQPQRNECYINTIAVKNEFRKLKVGSRLIGSIIDYAIKSKFKNIKTRTWSTNKSGLNLYNKFGFETDYVIANDRAHGVDSIYLSKILSIST